MNTAVSFGDILINITHLKGLLNSPREFSVISSNLRQGYMLKLLDILTSKNQRNHSKLSK